MKQLLLILIFLTTFRVSAQTLENDRLALVALYNATGGANWISKTGWNIPGAVGDNPCGWYGVTCNAADRVEELKLIDNNLYGELPVEIGSLTELKLLAISGADFSPTARSLSGDLSLTGTIPIQIGNLLKLEHLDLSNNWFEGSIPQSLGKLSKLKHLDLSYGPVDVTFDPNGFLSGSIPVELGNLSDLEYLDLARQSLSGAIPGVLGNLSQLKYLNLENNDLSGPIPTSFGALSNLTYLNLSYYFRHNPDLTDPLYAGETYIMFGKLSGTIPDFSGLPASAKVYLNNQSFTFDGMALNMSRLVWYAPQAKIAIRAMLPLSNRSLFGTLYVDAGGNVASNTFKWYKDNVLFQAITGNEYVNIQEEGIYRVEVTNTQVPGLTLISYDENVISLPVKLVSFTVKKKDHKNVLLWKTTSETDNAGFQIERSRDAINFEKIGFVDGNGESHEQNQYSFTDENPMVKTYYRLKQMDHSGKFEYSRTIAVVNAAADFVIFPNPASDHILVKNIASGNEIVVKDLDGKVLMNKKNSEGKPLDIRGLNNGIYLLTIGDVTKKLVVKK